MNYYVARGGQQYGPYTAEAVRRYLAEGSLLPSDHAREETAQQWTTLAQLFPSAPAAPAPPVAPAAAWGAPTPGYMAMPVPPPSLHWALVLLFGVLTLGIFSYIWAFVQSNWVRKIDAQSRATTYYVLWLLFGVVGAFFRTAGSVRGGDEGVALAKFSVLLSLVGAVFLIVGAFNIRRSLEAYYNNVEPIHLWMSGVMTFFFNILYIQYHLTRIAKWRQTGILTT